ncbi:alpha/beta hydrolase [Roseateles sp. SL47]|uniref:alpha/beta fold hydrolase n=1 Tax=Roseateles sp. SL47 TaxID=2995138 RepID=UPI00226E8DE4|nr:alpha/beta hydrolase [Roseateles sp. SL47]WAC71959.1 alpha/beta hydrolase [Roseateles sp. SL47]
MAYVLSSRPSLCRDSRVPVQFRWMVAAVALLLMALQLAPASATSVDSDPPTTSRILDRQQVIARFADADSRFTDIDGVQVHYKDQGRGPVVLLIHGTLGDVADWDGWVAVLARHRRVLRIDLPGFGLTGPLSSGNYSTARLLDLIDAFMDQMGVERFSLAGISYGGLVSFRYAATRTERVDALILINSAGVETGKPPPRAVAAGSSPAASAPSSASIFRDTVITAADIERNLLHMLVEPDRLSSSMVARKLAFANIAGRGEESIAGRTLYERGDPMRVLGHVRAPTLVLWGGGNRALTPATADLFVSGLRHACDAERVVYPDAGHLLIVDQPQRSAADALKFLQRVEAGAPCRSVRAAAP